MVLATLQGVIPVKMFDSGQTFDFSAYGPNYASWDFDAQSDQAMLNSFMEIPGFPILQAYSSEVMTVDGLNSMAYNPDDQSVGGYGASMIDGILSTIGPGSIDFSSYYSKLRPMAPGIWNPNPVSSYAIATDFSDTSYTGPIPMMLRGNKITGAISNSVHDITGSLILVEFTPNGAENINQLFVDNDIIRQLQSSPLGCRIPGFGKPADNCLYNGNNGTTTTNNSRFLWNSWEPGSFFLDSVNMDNPTLDALFQGEFGNFPYAKAYYNGFIFPLPTRGAGITKQNIEVCVFTNDMTGYYILLFQPQDAESETQLSRAGTVPQVKIDKDGIIWYNSGDGSDLSKVIYSFSSGYNFPVYYYGNLQPIILPCYVDTLPGVQYSFTQNP